MSERTLWLIRHAKTKRQGATDHQRELGGRGIRQAEEMSSRVQEIGEPLPQTVLASTATRARMTAERVWGKFKELTIALSSSLYTFDGERLIEAIQSEIFQQNLEDLERIGVVGHNYAISECVEILTQNRSSIDMPTLGIAVLKFDGEWNELSLVPAKLIHYVTPSSR